MDQAIQIRRATVADAAALTALARETFYDTFTGTCTEADMQEFLDAVFTETQLAKELADPEDYCVLAFFDDQLAGYLRCKEDPDSFPLMRQWKAIELKRIYVTKRFLGKGIAQALMDWCLAFATHRGYEAIWLGVWEHNERAKRFYEKYAFTDSGHRHGFPIGQTPQTDLWLWRFLKV